MQAKYVTITALVLALTAMLWSGFSWQSQKKAQIALQNSQLQNFYTAYAATQALENNLNKALIGQETENLLLSQLRLEALQAQENLSRLPGAEQNLENSLSFLNQAADYFLSLQKENLAAFSQDQWHNLHNLVQKSRYLNQLLAKIQLNLEKGKKVELLEDKEFSSELASLSENLEQMPTLLYDGPFSDHLQQNSVLPAQKITAAEAEKIAAELSGSPVVSSQKLDSQPAVYQVNLQNQQILGITEQGGRLLWSLTDRNLEAAQISHSEAQKAAQAYLEKQGFGSMLPTYQEEQDNRIIFSFAAEQDGVILYGDLIKTEVALDRAEVVALDAADYWDSHLKRNLPRPNLTSQEAQSYLNPRLTEVSAGRLALIPRTDSSEVLTYEFQGKWGQDTYLIYINAEDGSQEQIFQLRLTEAGKLVQ